MVMKQVEEDLMDKMVVEADCIPGGIDGEVPCMPTPCFKTRGEVRRRF